MGCRAALRANVSLMSYSDKAALNVLISSTSGLNKVVFAFPTFIRLLKARCFFIGFKTCFLLKVTLHEASHHNINLNVNLRDVLAVQLSICQLFGNTEI